MLVLVLVDLNWLLVAWIQSLCCLLTRTCLAKLLCYLGAQFKGTLHDLLIQTVPERVVLSDHNRALFAWFEAHRVACAFERLHKTHALELGVVDCLFVLTFFFVVNEVHIAVAFFANSKVLLQLGSTLRFKTCNLLLRISILLCAASHELSNESLFLELSRLVSEEVSICMAIIADTELGVL